MGPWFQKGTKAASNYLYLHTANVRSRNHWKIKKYTHKCSHQLLTDCPSIETPKVLDLCFLYTLCFHGPEMKLVQSLQLVSLLCSWFHHVSHVKTVHYFCLFFLNMCTSFISGLCFRVESLMCFVLVYSFSPLLSVLSRSFCLSHGSQDNILHVYCLYSLCTSLTSPQYKSLSCALDFTACLFHSVLLVSRGKQEAETTDIKTRLF